MNLHTRRLLIDNLRQVQVGVMTAIILTAGIGFLSEFVVAIATKKQDLKKNNPKTYK